MLKPWKAIITDNNDVCLFRLNYSMFIHEMSWNMTQIINYLRWMWFSVQEYYGVYETCRTQFREVWISRFCDMHSKHQCGIRVPPAALWEQKFENTPLENVGKFQHLQWIELTFIWGSFFWSTHGYFGTDPFRTTEFLKSNSSLSPSAPIIVMPYHARDEFDFVVMWSHSVELIRLMNTQIFSEGFNTFRLIIL